MKRTFRSFLVNDFLVVKEQMLNWANQFSICCFLDGHQYKQRENDFECLLAVDADQMLCTSSGKALAELQEFIERHGDWCFGHLGYDLKNEIENICSASDDFVKFDDLCFFIPKIIIILRQNQLLIGSGLSNHDAVAKEIFNAAVASITDSAAHPSEIKSRFSREEYLDTVGMIQKHILRGDCYELNFCQEFFIEDAVIDPLQVYKKLSEASPNPFSCYYKLHDKYLLCASPERYLSKKGNKLISQPIKGTVRRDLTDPTADIRLREGLRKSPKECAENIMIADLVRNDLSRVCKEATVRVEELMGIYAFPQVYQMISTVSGEVDDNITVADILKATFPMGSMTGAPKKRVMQLIEQYERTKRGLFSGSVGYITPTQDMDFNVVIRSILYNASARYLSFQTGSAITGYSKAEDEYAECLLKSQAIKKVLNG